MPRLGLVSSYAHNRLVPDPRASATGQELFDDYLAWCERNGHVALRNRHFRLSMEQLARDVGITIVQDGGNTVYLEVGIRSS